MLKPRFYYSAPIALGTAKVFLSPNGSLSHVLEDSFKVTKNLPRTTICGILDDEKKTLTFGYAKCSPKDNFSKSMGRKISLGRATNAPICTIQLDALDKVSEVFLETAARLEEQINLSSGPIVFVAE